MSQINIPLIYAADPTTSRSLFNADLYFGLVDQKPFENGILDQSKLKAVSALQENGTLVALSQPVPTNSGGQPTYNGSPVTLDIDGDFSYQAISGSGIERAYVPRVTNSADESVGFSGVVTTEEQTLSTLGQVLVTFSIVSTSSAVFYLHTRSGDQGFLNEGDDYVIVSPTVIRLTQSRNVGDKVVARQNDPTGQLVTVNPDASQLLVFDTVGDAQGAASLGNLLEGDTVTLNEGVGGRSGGDKYLVQLQTVTNDNVNYIFLDGVIQLAVLNNEYRFQNYSEKIGIATISTGILTIDLNEGMVQTVVLTEDVTSWVILNFNPDSNYSSSFNLVITQDATGGRGLAFPSPLIKWSGGVVPTVTATANAVDEYGFRNRGSATTWSGVTLSQDES